MEKAKQTSEYIKQKHQQKVDAKKAKQEAREKKPKFGKTIVRLFRFMSTKYRVLTAFALIMALAGVALQIILPTFINRLVLQIAAGLTEVGMNTSLVIRYVIMLGSFGVGAIILGYAQAIIMVSVTQRVVKNIRAEIIEKINVMPLKYFDTNSFGDILSRLTNDVTQIGEWLGHLIITIFTSVSLLGGVLIMMFVSNWILALVAVGSTIVGVGAIFIMLKMGQKYFKAQQVLLGKLNGEIEEAYTGHSVVKVYNAAHERRKQFRKTNRELEKNTATANFFTVAAHPLMGFMGNLGFVAICVTASLLIFNGHFGTTGEGFAVMSAFLVYIMLFSQPLMQLGEASQGIQLVGASSERVFEFLNEDELECEKEMLSSRDFSFDVSKIVGAVEFKNVKFGYDVNKTIIKDFSYKIKAGSSVAIVGPTGAGKTTIVNLLMRFYEIWKGEILIDDINIKSLTREEVHSIFGMVLQDSWVFEGTIRDNILFNQASELSEYEKDSIALEAAKLANLDHYIKTLPKGFDTIIDEKANISAGQKQLLTIARAFANKKPMLILDEATSSVDTRTEVLIQDAMEKLTLERTTFVIAHRLSTIKNADVILVLKDGDIIESGSHSELIKRGGFYSDLYSSQFNE